MDASLFILTIVYIEREGSFLSPRFISICLCVLYIPEYRDINQRLPHVQREMTHVRDTHISHDDCLTTSVG